MTGNPNEANQKNAPELPIGRFSNQSLLAATGDFGRYRTPSILIIDLGRHLMQTVLSMLLLVTAIAVAFFDARDLFIEGYSITELEPLQINA